MYRERDFPATDLTIAATIIPHNVNDGRHSAEIVLTDSRWPVHLKVPRPAIMVELEKPFDPIADEHKLRRAFEKTLLEFIALGVVSTIVHRSRGETVPESSGSPVHDPTGLSSSSGDSRSILTAMKQAGIEVPLEEFSSRKQRRSPKLKR
jgi:hypothetical protein